MRASDLVERFGGHPARRLGIDLEASEDKYRNLFDKSTNAIFVTNKQGRILVPSHLKEAASLEGTVVLSGNIDRVELWNPGRYRSSVQSAPAQELERFAHRIFG